MKVRNNNNLGISELKMLISEDKYYILEDGIFWGLKETCTISDVP